MPITSTIWEMKPHTRIKHEILKRYIDAWIPILSKFKRINYIDGFAGPGKYSLGEEGSPLIAIKSICNHKLKPNLKSLEINFLFIEIEPERHKNLEYEISLLKKACSRCIRLNKCNIKIYNGKFEDIFAEVLNSVKVKNSHLAPSFVFIDPFGFSGFSLDIVKQLMNNPHCEVLITFMYEEINRFSKLPGNEKHLDSLFGTNDWKDILENSGLKPEEKAWELKNLYQKNLKNLAGIKYAHSFLMINENNKPDYFLIFGSNNDLGLIRMKQAMRKSDETGKFTFSDVTYDPQQTVLFSKTPNYSELKRLILSKYKGRTINMNELINFVGLETPFVETDLRGPILRIMERDKEIEVSNRKRPETYPKEAIIKFK